MTDLSSCLNAECPLGIDWRSTAVAEAWRDWALSRERVTVDLHNTKVKSVCVCGGE